MSTVSVSSSKDAQEGGGADSELREHRNLIEPPKTWNDGFGLKAMIGAVFIGMVMTPASMYMSLVQGADIGPAAQWVTILLFIEVARRAFTTLKRPEIFVLFYMAGVSLISTSPLHGPLWNQFMVQSQAFKATGISSAIPSWVAPSSPDVLGSRSFFRVEWVAPLGLIALGLFVQRLDHFGLGYAMYRLTSDVEKLPYPMAAVGAQGVNALADASGGEDSWRWRVFSFGAMLGLAFGAVYVALPAVTGTFLSEPLSILPFPFKDLTGNTEDFLPGVPMILAFDLGLIILGMVLPFWAMVGGFVGLVVTIVMNVVMHRAGVLHTWRPGIGAIATINANYLDFYLSWGLGLTAAVAVIGIWHLAKAVMVRNKGSAKREIDWSKLFKPVPGRGDFSIWIGIGVYVASTILTIVLSAILLTIAHHENPLNSPVTKILLGIFAFYGFVYTPLLCYATVRMEGLIGHSVVIPFVRESTFIMSGYKGAAIWFAPFPVWSFSDQTRYFRACELTGTKFTSLIKAELFALPVMLLAIVIFSQFIWHIAPVPSSAFPYAQQFWESFAYRQSIIASSTLPGGEHGPFFEAFKLKYLLSGFGVAVGSYAIVSLLGWPILLVYGLIRGLDGSTPQVIVAQFVGALLGRFYFRKKFGEKWHQYIVVFAAGYACGVGLIMMFSLGLVFISTSVNHSAF
jgi:hypothetical protein